ncbi:hypothetical protein GY45DRAFT_1318507 [Cubamyces sp. BRFM 1775]|nr:hypothetical protein GY45DRAFT_1318507 [Cubamyces sp. BRFM 1775]
MPCFTQKRLPSSPPPLLGARPPPHKRIKITHPSERPLSDVSPSRSGHPHRNASLALLSNADQTPRLVPSPLTRCHAANEVCDSKPREYEHLAPEQMPQTLLSWNASHQLLHDEAQRASKSKSALVSGTSAAHATPEDVRYISPTNAFVRSSSASPSLSLCPSEPVPPMAYISVAEPGPPTYYCSQLPPANTKTLPIADPLVAAPARMSPSDVSVLDYLYDGLEDGSYDFTGMDVLSQFDFSGANRLSDMQDCDPDMASLVARSPISRSMSRSSFGSSSYMESSSPYDYPTPASDSSVTTPAPNEATFGWTSAFCNTLLGQEVPFGPEAKGKEPQHSYVQDFSGSAPLSPNAFSTYSFDAFSPASSALPPSTSGSLTGARRHSEPANLAALQFPLFFQAEFLQIPPPPPAAEAATLPIADNISPPSAGPPSSIAPHQTELPRPLEIKQPKPVRAYKPPILRADCQFDPKDFVTVRRHSEPIVALREFDVGSHLPLDASEESADEADEPMVFEGADEELYEGEEPFDDMEDEASMDSYFEGFHEVEQGSLGEPLFDPHWSWVQPDADSSSSTSQPCPMTNLFNADIDWTAAFAGLPATGVASAARLDGLFHH